MQYSEEPSKLKYKFSNIPGIEQLSTGPSNSPRSCTDPLCFVLFILVAFYFMGVSCMAVFMGDVDLIGAPYDPDHRACGVDNEAIDYPFIYFATPSIDSTGNYLYRTVCLKECPSNIGSNVYDASLECLTNTIVTSCNFQAHPENESVLYYNTISYLGKICLPEATMYFTVVEDYIDAGWVTDVIVDVKHSFFMISAGLVFALFLVLFLLKCLQWCDKVMIRCLLGVYFTIFLLFGGEFIYKGFSTDEIDGTLMFQNESELLNSASVSSDGLLAYIIAGSFLVLVAFATSIYLCLHQDYTKILSGIVQATFEFLSDNNILILFAFSIYLLLSFIILTSIALALFIYSVGSIDDSLSYNQYFPFNQFKNTPFFYYNLFGLLAFMLWICYIFLGLYQFVIMGTASHWYFRDTHIDAESRRKGIKRQNDEISYTSRAVVKKYIGLGFTKNFGSIALGSFLIMTFGWLNTIVTFIKEKLEISYKRNMNNKSCFNSFYKCFEWFFNHFIRYHTETGYIMIAYKGDTFINSGLLMSFIVDEYYDIFSEISALTTLLAVGLNIVCSLVPSVIFYYVFEFISWYGNNLSSSIHPALTIGLLTLINVSICNTIFSNIVDTLIICYCLEKETLKFNRKMLHFNKDPEYQQIPKEPSLENKTFLNKLLESFPDKIKKSQTTELSAIDFNVKSPPQEAPKKKLPKKTCIIKPETRVNQSNIGVGNVPNSTAGSQYRPNNRFVEQYSLPKVNDIIRASSPIKHVWISEEKQPPAASKNRLEQQRSPYKEAPFSEVIKNTFETGFNFQRENAINALKIDLKLDDGNNV